MNALTPARRLRAQLRAWADSRQPASGEHCLGRRSLYIFPSRAGLGFLVLNLTLWLVGTNYENNLVLGLAFLMVALFVVTILHTFANLSGISVRRLGGSPAISGEKSEVRLLVRRSGSRPRDNVVLRWAGSEPVVLSLFEQDEETVSVFVPTAGRGWFNPGRLVVETRYPLGLLRCWTRLNMDCQILVYPRPVPAGPLPLAESLRDEGEQSSSRGHDEFAGYRDYQAGDSLRDVAWKHYARGMGLHTKDSSAYLDRRLWLDWDYLGGMDREARLSRLCYWVLEADRGNVEYGLRLPGESLPPGRGSTHRDQALQMLALFETGELRTRAGGGRQ
ncbi:DUF58 domain-containing protein [Gilvimarinus sp. F26214L]|uniref:DUF58 domain-containing protein n=1 Tax=Gilvimarinus sp. DZF01 TaxID=3461371 RepID=UPI004045897E